MSSPCSASSSIRRRAAAAAIAFLAAFPEPAASFAADAESEFRGRRLAEANCAGCHAIAGHDESAIRAARPFRLLGRHIDLATLRRDFAGFFRRHPRMPGFEPTRQQADDIVDFIESIQR